MSKKTMIIGATPNEGRYAFKAAEMLQDHGHEIIPFGIKKGETAKGKKIVNDFPDSEKEINTVTLYVNPSIQKEYYDRIIALNPERVIFNPGTENPEFENRLNEHGIDFEKACTLVLLSTGGY